MEPNETQEAPQEVPNVEEGSTFENLMKVTPLSKYLAMALFVILPFLGGYVGYTFAPEKVVEIEKTVIERVEPSIQYSNSPSIVTATTSTFVQPCLNSDRAFEEGYKASDDLYFRPAEIINQLSVIKNAFTNETAPDCSFWYQSDPLIDQNYEKKSSNSHFYFYGTIGKKLLFVKTFSSHTVRRMLYLYDPIEKTLTDLDISTDQLKKINSDTYIKMYVDTTQGYLGTDDYTQSVVLLLLTPKGVERREIFSVHNPEILYSRCTERDCISNLRIVSSELYSGGWLLHLDESDDYKIEIDVYKAPEGKDLYFLPEEEWEQLYLRTESIEFEI